VSIDGSQIEKGEANVRLTYIRVIAVVDAKLQLLVFLVIISICIYFMSKLL
jgi:hypothetical protein